MATLEELLEDRTEAGLRYAAAVTELRASYVDLFGIELAINRPGPPAGGPRVPSFRGDLDQIPWELRHPQFAPDAGSGLVNAAKAKAATVSTT
ncbi:MAG: hypothetical protein KF735_08565 [Chelatococcus sp.]|uniref:hypothetical protein n=1 Tax=Chelatococcus sp. TaxID=1953771 RepID=UPI0025C10C0D|nr:hypothetical protein [Chelatococcus sp.]MBX3537676.1 hypothetical protein [Chelatococcus sp.]